MCQRSLARSEPYKLKLQLSYTDYNVTTLTEGVIDIKLNDPCDYKSLSTQDFFDLSKYSLITYGDPIFLNLSATYLPDNVTVWSGEDYFCGFPSYEVVAVNSADDKVVLDSTDVDS